MTPDAITIVRVASAGDLRAVTRVHEEVFVDNLSGGTGRRFVEEYFERIVAAPGGVLYAGKDGDRVVGFVAGLTSKQGFLAPGFMLRGLRVTLWQLLVRPSIVVNILFSLKRMLVGRVDCEAELLSIGVAETYRQTGVATRLVESLEGFFRTQDVERYKVYTDNKLKAAVAFYERLGFVLERQVRFLHISERLYVKRLASAPAAHAMASLAATK
jgi:ribosomal protein S18 acetylase RimI-like enzyme